MGFVGDDAMRFFFAVGDDITTTGLFKVKAWVRVVVAMLLHIQHQSNKHVHNDERSEEERHLQQTVTREEDVFIFQFMILYD